MPDLCSLRTNTPNRYDLTPPSETEDIGEHLAVEQTFEPLVAVIGVGYVGEHLVKLFSSAFRVLGYDLSLKRVQKLQAAFKDTNVQFTTSPHDLAAASHFLISVPTLLQPDKRIASSALRSALRVVAVNARPGSTVVVESSIAVGMTREFLGPLAKEKTFFAGMSPERVDPGRVDPAARSIPKVISGLDDVVPGSLEAISSLYSAVFDTVVPVSSPEVAEMTKLYENCQRMVGIAYANEMADACVGHRIDPFEVCAAAATKPFGYMPFTPSLGVGGHCIPVNPHYLLSNSSFPLLEAATAKMVDRPAAIARRIVADYAGSRPRVLVVGIGFKAGQSHLANSPGRELAKALVVSGRADVTWADALVPQDAVPQIQRLADSEWTAEVLEERFDLIAVAFRQHGMDQSVLEALAGPRIMMWCC